jgi:uncharacterized protein with HEPN domain
MTRNTILYLQDILDNMRWAEEFVGGVTHEVFAADRKTVYAVLRCLEVIERPPRMCPLPFVSGILPFPGRTWLE